MTFKTDAQIREKLGKHKFKDAEEIEMRRGVNMLSGYPKPARRFRLEFESENVSVEEPYFWLTEHARDTFYMPILDKIIDSHASSPGSSIFGDMQSRVGAQQSNASNYLASIGRLIKDLFKLVRELRQVKERLEYYNDSFGEKQGKAKSAERTLKDAWVTLVEGGTNNPASVYGMSKTVGFTILPDLFFEAPPFNQKDPDEAKEAIANWIEKQDFNKTVLQALDRKLYQFTVWKLRTHEEIKNKYQFQIGYLRQHFETVRMYMQWIRPYLSNIRRLQDNEQMMDNAALVTSFETAMSEVEVLCIRPPKERDDDHPEDDVYSVVSFQFLFRTKPQLDFHKPQAYHQKGPIHVGRADIFIRAYGWTQAEIEKYKEYREQDTFDMFMSMDQSVNDAMLYLGEDLRQFLKEAYVKSGQEVPKLLFSKEELEKPEEKKKDTAKDTVGLLTSPFEGLYDLFFEPFIGTPNEAKKKLFGNSSKKSPKESKIKAAKKQAAKDAGAVAWQCYKNYKKAHGMVAW